MRIIVFLLLLTSCTQQVCLGNLNITPENKLLFEEQQQAVKLPEVFARSMSVNGEVMTVRIYQNEEEYYVRYHPARSRTEVYGPFQGDGLEAIRCDTEIND